MLLELKSDHDLDVAVNAAKQAGARCLMFWHTIQFRRRGLFGDFPYRHFVYPSLEEPHYLFTFQDVSLPYPMTLVETSLDSVDIDEELYTRLVNDFFEKSRFLEKIDKLAFFWGPKKLCKLVDIQLPKDIACEHSTVQLFYLDEERQKLLAREELSLPDGYHFDVVRVDEAQMLYDCWQYAFPGDKERLEEKIRYFPSVCIRTEDGTAASFEVISEHGTLNHHYTFPEHRRKGLGDVVERKLATKWIELGFIPFECINCLNPKHQRVLKSGPFIVLRDRDGQAVDFDYFQLTRRQ